HHTGAAVTLHKPGARRNQVSSPRARTFPTKRICLTGRLTKLTHDATMIFNDECEVVNDPGKRERLALANMPQT
ncbi:MAG: hypothetical protein WB660_15215, partial [Candidatus Sulfotelmatobacter sp.]